jgi:hypothetical protein
VNPPPSVPIRSDQILSRVRRFFETQPSARVRFEVAARNAYFDLKPFLDRYRRGD